MQILALWAALVAAEPGGRVEYVGGTLNSVEQKTGGRLQAVDGEQMVFAMKRGRLTVPYRDVNLLEYGQKVDRRYLAAALISPMFLLSKKRDHFLTVGYADKGGQQQAIVFRVEKGDVRSILASMEARTGLKVQYQDNEARKAAWGSR